MSARLVSVILPTRDRPLLLRQALASIRAIEGDDVKFEIIVADNGTAPETKAFAEEFGAIYTTQKNITGSAATRNACMRLATGEFLAFIDDDDLWMETHIRGHIAMLDARPDLDCALGQIICTDMALRPITDVWPEKDPGHGDELILAMLNGYYPQLGATVARRSVLETFGYFDETLIGDQDWDWQLRMARAHKIGFVPQKCVLFRQRPPGSFDKLRLVRLDYARKVFFRHAIPSRHLFPNPVEFMRAYTRSLMQYFTYFIEGAVARSERNDRIGTLQAMWGAFKTFPARTIWHLIMPRPMRGAFLNLINPLHKPNVEATS